MNGSNVYVSDLPQGVCVQQPRFPIERLTLIFMVRVFSPRSRRSIYFVNYVLRNREKLRIPTRIDYRFHA